MVNLFFLNHFNYTFYLESLSFNMCNQKFIQKLSYRKTERKSQHLKYLTNYGTILTVNRILTKLLR